MTEFLALLEALQGTVLAGLQDKGTSSGRSLDESFYYLARAVLVKDERHYDRFDRAFAAHFAARGRVRGACSPPKSRRMARRHSELALTDEEKARIESLGGWDALMETLRQRLEEQKARHEGGNVDRHRRHLAVRHAGYNPEGVRIGGKGGNRRAVKVWDRREYANLDDSVELDTRNIKLALRRLRRFARRARRTSSTSTAPSSRPRGTRGCSRSAWCPSGTMP